MIDTGSINYHWATMDQPITLDISAIKTIGMETVPSVYCNNAGLTMSPWDIRVVFSEIVLPATAEQTAATYVRANVVMNPGHAKALVAALLHTIQLFESTYGEIKMPPVVNPDGQ